jgi:IS1 family transposase
LIEIYLEGCGIRSLGRIFNISPDTVINVIRKESAKVHKPQNFQVLSNYEMDQLNLFVGKKSNRIWLIYAIEKDSKQVVGFKIGSGSKLILYYVIKQILSFNPKRVYTDKLNIYPSLITDSIHRTTRFKTNTIERLNLTLRTQLKRLLRKSICFSRSIDMLKATLKLFFWLYRGHLKLFVNL